MAAPPAQEKDPLIAALPPATDYITYLTLLEYQLTPQNLSTLNSLLSEDDGTLAAEIGWDLLKLVLPMLSNVPNEAIRCLQIIARRGNPREVVVRVAEVLEELGQNEENELIDDSDDEGSFQAFEGEAERIHLGNITLGGMQKLSEAPAVDDENPANVTDNADYDRSISNQAFVLKSLLDMLSILHRRIKTRYPSRFLATSLPAALRAFRRTTISAYTTSAYLSFLSKIASKQAPALPPRASNTSATPLLSTALPLPDPEASIDHDIQITPSEGEREIILRLCQAAMLEILEEYCASLQLCAIPSLEWTVRLREMMEPGRLVPGKTTETQRWQNVEELLARDNLITEFLKVSKDLDLDIRQLYAEAFSKISLHPDSLDTAAEADIGSEFPKSPSDVPFSLSGIALILAADLFTHTTESVQAISHSTLYSDSSRLFSVLCRESALANTAMSLGTVDALLTPLYLSTVEQRTLPQTGSVFNHFIIDLAALSATCPSALLRDSAHTIATRVFHSHPVSEDKVQTAKAIMQTTESWTLKAVAVDWLKDEILMSLRQGSGQGVDPEVLEMDKELEDVLFTSDYVGTENKDMLALRLPYLIACLNLFYIVRTKTTLSLDKGEHMVISLRKLIPSGSAEVGLTEPPTWALEDAVTRATKALDVQYV